MVSGARGQGSLAETTLSVVIYLISKRPSSTLTIQLFMKMNGCWLSTSLRDLRVHSRGKFVNANLIYHLRHIRQPAYPEVNLVNRLDAGTSGLVLLAREQEQCSAN